MRRKLGAFEGEFKAPRDLIGEWRFRSRPIPGSRQSHRPDLDVTEAGEREMDRVET